MSSSGSSPEQNDALEIPPGFESARDAVQEAIGFCEVSRIPQETIVAALLIELMPRLVETYGTQAVAAVLARLAGEVEATRHTSAIRQ